MNDTLVLVEKSYGEEPKHALILNDVLINEQTTENLNALVAIAERLSSALQIQYSLVVCKTKSQFEALIKEPEASWSLN